MTDSCLNYRAEYERLKRETTEANEKFAEIQQKYDERGREIDKLKDDLEKANKCISILQEDYGNLNSQYRTARDKNEELQQMHRKVKAQRDALIYSARAMVLGVTE